MGSLVATDYKQPKQIYVNSCKQIGQIYGTEHESNPQAGRVYDCNYISPTIDTCSGGNKMSKIIVTEATKRGYAEAGFGDTINIGQLNSKTRRERVGHGVCNTLTCQIEQGVLDVNSRKVRKLTPTECYRLMGLNDLDIERERAVGISDCSLYKQAGNGIVTNCVELIMEHLYKAQYDESYICFDENF